MDDLYGVQREISTRSFLASLETEVEAEKDKDNSPSEINPGNTNPIGKATDFLKNQSRSCVENKEDYQNKERLQEDTAENWHRMHHDDSHKHVSAALI